MFQGKTKIEAAKKLVGSLNTAEDVEKHLYDHPRENDALAVLARAMDCKAVPNREEDNDTDQRTDS